MANRTGPALVPHDQGNQKIGNLGRGTLPADAARRDDIIPPADIVPDHNGGAGYSGIGLENGNLPASVRHSHPERDPESVGSTFYPAYIPNPLHRPSARAVLTNGASTFGWATGAFVAVPNAPYTWQRVIEGPLMAQHASGVAPFAFNDGDYFFAGFGAEYPPDPTESQYYGLYRVIDCGTHIDGVWPGTSDPRVVLTRATFVRADEMNQVSEFPLGAFVQITGDGALYQGQYFATTVVPVTLDVTPLAFEIVSTVDDSPPSYKLLTGPQLTTEGADNTTQTTTIAATNAAFTFDPETATLIGTPGLSEIPAGPFRVTARLRVSAAAGAGCYSQFFYSFRLRHADNSTSANFLDAVSPPLNSTVDFDYTFTAFLATPVACSPTDRVEAVPGFVTTNPTEIVCTFTYQDPTRATRIVMPFIAPSGVFAGFHNDLGGRDENCHPEPAIIPGLGAATATAAGVLTMPAGARTCIVTGTEDLIGISTTGIPAGATLRLFFASSRNVLHNSTVGTGVAHFFFCEFGTGVRDVTIPEFMGSLHVQLLDLTAYGYGLCWVKI